MIYTIQKLVGDQPCGIKFVSHKKFFGGVVIFI